MASNDTTSQDSWICPVCTYNNHALLPYCEICNANQPSSRQQTTDSSGQNAHSDGLQLDTSTFNSTTQNSVSTNQNKSLMSTGYCRYYGSALGCKNGNHCNYSHDNPNSVPLCRFINNHCKYGNQCTYRHQEFPSQFNMKLPSIPSKSQKMISQDETVINEKLVCGFIRQHEYLLNGKLFPHDIYFFVLSFYFKAFWDQNTSHPKIKIENRRITSLFDGYNASAFSLIGIEKGSEVHVWKLRIIKCIDYVVIGITDNPNKHEANEHFYRLSGSYSYWSAGRIYSDGGTNDGYTYFDPKNAIRCYGPNSIISVHLDMKRYQVSFKVNGKEFDGVLKLDLKRSDKYYLGVGLGKKGCCVEIVE